MNMEHEVCLILPYFGKFNSYFNLWLTSCKYNDMIDWYIFTDDKSLYPYPENVKANYCSFQDIQKKAYDLFGYDIQLDKPYDLCKFKVAYHKLFSEVTGKYKYWGFCDCDLIWGDLYSAIRPALVQKYDKISWRGHFTLFRNTAEINNLYLSEIPGNTTFKSCIAKQNNEINLFDECGINRIFDYFEKSVYKKLLFADLKVKCSHFVCNHFSSSEQYKNEHQIFEWNKGKLYRVYVYNSQIHKEEFIYVHFLRREMDNLIMEDTDHFLIVPNKFLKYNDLSASQIINFSQSRIYWKYYKNRLKLSYLIKVVKRQFTKKKTPDVYPYIIK